MGILLTRDQFREAVLARSKGKCVLCEAPAVDAHHILERRLWPDGGYYLDNGAAVCGEHHLACERTLIELNDLRAACGITKVILPPHMYTDQEYDKWGNIIMPNGQRLRGELFYDESVQKVLNEGNVLGLFTHYVKYPRTHHLPWSQNLTEDDRMLSNMDGFIGKRVIVTTKMDGENTTMYSDRVHARSIDSGGHISRSWVKQFWSTIAMDIPSGWRVCGENLYAKHSIEYKDLASYFMGFSIWNDRNVCLSWDQTCEWFELLGICSVPVLYDGVYDEKIIKALWDKKAWEGMEGYVVRVADELTYKDFKHVVGKFVREKHVQTVKHWMHGQPMVKNELSKNQV